LQHGEQTNPVFERVEEERVVADIIQEPLLPQSDFATDPGPFTKRVES